MKEKLQKLINLLREKGENDKVNDIEEIIISCSQYITKSTRFAAAKHTVRLTKDTSEYLPYISGLEKGKKEAFSSLSGNISILNKYCREVDMEPIYSHEDTGNRELVQQFAFELVKSLL